jgi:hypothetical protein
MIPGCIGAVNYYLDSPRGSLQDRSLGRSTAMQTATAIYIYIIRSAFSRCAPTNDTDPVTASRFKATKH